MVFFEEKEPVAEVRGSMKQFTERFLLKSKLAWVSPI